MGTKLVLGEHPMLCPSSRKFKVGVPWSPPFCSCPEPYNSSQAAMTTWHCLIPPSPNLSAQAHSKTQTPTPHLGPAPYSRHQEHNSGLARCPGFWASTVLGVHGRLCSPCSDASQAPIPGPLPLACDLCPYHLCLSLQGEVGAEGARGFPGLPGREGATGARVSGAQWEHGEGPDGAVGGPRSHCSQCHSLGAAGAWEA